MSNIINMSGRKPTLVRHNSAMSIAGRSVATQAAGQVLSQRAQRMKRNAYRAAHSSTKLVAHPLANLNNANARQKRAIVNVAVIRLVSAIQDLLEMSGYSLSQMIHKEVVTATGKYSGVTLGAARVAVSVLSNKVIRVIAAAIYRWVPNKPMENITFISKALERSKKSIDAIAAGKKVDLRPVVSSIIMNMTARDARTMGKNLVKYLLDTYVYSAYVSSGGGGTMCKLCSKVSCGSNAPVKATAHNAARLSLIVQKVFKAINSLLSIDDRRPTVTQAIRQAADSNISSAAVKQVAVLWAKWTPSTGAVLMGVIVQMLHPWLNSKLRSLGLEIDKQTFWALAVKDLPSLVRFVAKDPKADVEPFLVRLVAGAKPVGVLSGLVGARYGTGTSEFCTLCKTVYGTCAR